MLEAVSKPPHDDIEAGEIYKFVKKMSVVLVTNGEPAEVLELADRALDLPAASVASELAAALCGRLAAIFAVRTHQFDAAARQACSQRTAVASQVVDQLARFKCFAAASVNRVELSS